MMSRSLRSTSIVLSLLSFFVAALPLTAQDPQQQDEEPELPPVVFDRHEPLEFTLVADFEQLEDDRDDEEEERPALLRMTSEDGSPVELDVELRTRGNFRLRRSTCEMPNLRLDVRTGQAEGTVFQAQDKLKVVGYCRDNDAYEQNALEEYLVYRIYNLLTEVSFQVRLARITYEDVNGNKDTVTRYGFLIEDEEAMAARLAGVIMNVPAAPPQDLAAVPAVRMSLFQYMVGNTDWSMAQFHNTVLVRLPDGQYVSVPYGFDWTGLVNARYARPDQSLGTRSVRQRVYRGFCRPQVDFDAVYDEFRAKRDEINALIESVVGLEEDNAEEAIEYLDEFYETIDNDGRARRYIERACRQVSR